MPSWFITFCTHPVTLLMLGGGIGTNARFWLGKQVAKFQGEVLFPWGTFIINVSGAAILGLVAAAYSHHKDQSHVNWYLLLGTGFCGGFTTFSTFSYETLALIQEGKAWIAVLYAVGSVLAGLLGVWLAVTMSGR